MTAASTPPERRMAGFRLAVFSVFMGFVSVMPLLPQGRFPSFDSSAYIFVADGMLAGRIPYAQLWENKGLPLYFLDAFGRLITPGSYNGIWLLELLFMSLTFAGVWWVLRKLVTLPAALFAAALLVLGIVMTSVGGNTPEFWTMAGQAAGLVAAWTLIQGDTESRLPYMTFVGFCAGIAGMTKLNTLGTWIALFILIVSMVVARRLPLPGALRILGVMAIGFFAGTALAVAPVIAWGVTQAWWDQTIGFGLNFSSAEVAGSRVNALLQGLNRIAFISWSLIAGLVFAPVAWLVGKRPKIEPVRLWMYAFLLIWLAIELMASSANGRPYTHYSMPWLIPSTVLIGMLWSSPRRPVLTLVLPLAVAFAGVLHVLPILDAKLNFHRGFPPVVVAESKYFKLAQVRMVEEIRKRTEPSDTVFVWGWDPVAFTESGRLSAGPYSHPLTMLLMPGYQSESQFDDLVSQLEQDPPKLIIDSTHIRDDMPSLWDLRARTTYDTSRGRVQPYMHTLPDFVQKNYKLVVTRWPHVEYYELKTE